jgi:hydroxymethylbilane synthase
VMLPAVGQGALAIECRAEDSVSQSIVRALDDPATHAAVIAERAMLASLRGGCMAPVGALGQITENQLHLSAVVLSADGVRRHEVHDREVFHSILSAEELGRRVADALLKQGAEELIAESRSGFSAGS